MAPPSDDLAGSDEVPCGYVGKEMEMDRDVTKTSLTVSDSNNIVGEKDDIRLPTPAVVDAVNAADGLGVARTADIATPAGNTTLEVSPGASSSLLSTSDYVVGAERDKSKEHEQKMAAGQQQIVGESTGYTGLESEMEDGVIVNGDNEPSIVKMDSTAKPRDESKSENNAPSLLDYARRGAVGAVGGTMTLVGLVMIPLPTPFGAVIASSGLAVLGTEFKGAKELNDRLIEGAKQGVHHAREYMVQSIESMEDDEFDTDKKPQPTFVSVTQTETDKKDDNIAETHDPNEIARDYESKSSNIDNSEDNEGPKWLHMNQVERERQARLAQEKYKQETKTNYQSTSEYLTKKTGLSSFLTRTVLPVLKGNDKDNRAALQQQNDDAALVANDKTMMTESSVADDDGFVMVEEEGAMGSEALVNPDVPDRDR